MYQKPTLLTFIMCEFMTFFLTYRAELFLRIVALLGLHRHKGGAVEALVARLLGQRLVGHAGLRAGLRDGDGAGHGGGNQEDQHDEAADPSLLSLLQIKQ